MDKKRKSAEDGKSGTSRAEPRLHKRRKGDLTEKIERLELFEERLDVRLEGLSAFLDVDSNFLHVLGELHPRDGTELNTCVELVVTAYEQDGRVAGTSSTSFDPENFFGFEAFNELVCLPLPNMDIIRIRVYPKKG